MKAISISYLQSVFDVLYCRCDTPVWAIVVIIISLILLLVISIFAIFNCKKLIEECNSAKKLASIDPLTGLLNRQAINKIFEDKLTVQHRGSTGFSIIFIDINGLKSINDKYGHLVGDCVLKVFAQSLSNSIRFSDYVGRWGGDEFIVLVSGMRSDADFSVFCSKLQQETSKIITVEGHEIKISASFGYARARVDGESVSDLIRVADSRMYKNKQHQFAGFC